MEGEGGSGIPGDGWMLQPTQHCKVDEHCILPAVHPQTRSSSVHATAADEYNTTFNQACFFSNRDPCATDLQGSIITYFLRL